ncbi:MAG: T9SS type A sorting domain-containing protein, partial [Bacteroidota bacterium]
ASEIKAFSGLEKVKTSLDIEDCGFRNLGSLQNLEQIGGSLILRENPDLSQLEGLNQLEQVGQQIIIVNNQSLQSLSSLQNLQSLGGSPETGVLFSIRNNPNLEDCCVLLKFVNENPNLSFILQGNRGSCESISRLTDLCTPDSKLREISLIQAETGSLIQNLQRGDVIDGVPLEGQDLSIRVETTVGFTGSLVFDLKGAFTHLQTENQAPFELFGDGQGRVFPAGFYALEVRMYSEKKGQGTLLDRVNLTFTLTANHPNLASFALINAQDGSTLQMLADGDVIDLNTLGTSQLNIQAKTNPEQIGSVKFELQILGTAQNRQEEVIENIAPYALFGNDPIDFDQYLGQALIPGSYTLKATPYTTPRAGGEAGLPLEIRFEVLEGSNLQVFPNPSAGEITLKTSQSEAFQILDAQGNVFKEGELEKGVQTNIQLPSGLYLLRSQQNGKVKTQKILIK